MTSRRAYKIFRLSFVCGWLCLSTGFIVISSPRPSQVGSFGPGRPPPADDPVLVWAGPVLTAVGVAGLGTAVVAAVLTVVLDSVKKRRPRGFDVIR